MAPRKRLPPEAKTQAQEQPKQGKVVLKDSRGRFLPGNKAAVGRKRKYADIDKLRKAIMAAVNEEDIIAITRKLIMMARKGDIRAADLLFNRVLGRVPVNILMNEGMDDSGPELKFL